MNDVRDEPLAGARLALNQDGRQTLERTCRTREQPIQLVAKGGDSAGFAPSSCCSTLLILSKTRVESSTL